MDRSRYIFRAGDGVNDQRDLQLNGRATPHPPQDLAGGAFLAHPEGYTGFAADGYWYQDGVKVGPELGDDFSDAAHPLNTRKWKVTAGNIWSQSADGLLVIFSGEDDQSFLIEGNRWHLKGDFLLRLKVTDCTIPTPDEGDVNAMWLGVSRLSDPSVWARVQRYRSTGADGFAAKLHNSALSFGAIAAAGAQDFELRLRRSEGVLNFEVVIDGEAGQILYSVEWGGIVVVEIGASHASNADDEGWGFRLDELVHQFGWHDYSNRASWAREAEGGLLYEDFWGDELDPTLWTETVVGSGNITVVPGVWSSEGEGLVLRTEGVLPSGGGTAKVSLPAVSGDFDLVVDFHFDDAALTVADAPEVFDRVLEIQLRANAAWPSLYLAVTNNSAGTLALGLYSRPDDASDLVGEAAVALPRLGGVRTMRAHLERRGLVLAVKVTEGDVVLMDEESSSLAFVPLAPSFYVATTNTTFETYITRLRIDTPCAVNLTAWPTRFYAATMGGDHEGDGIQAADVSIIDLATRAPVWRAFGHGATPGGLLSLVGAQGLVQGAAGEPWFDPATGVLWAPVTNADDTDLSCYVAFDLRLDRIWQFNADGLRRFGSAVEAPVGRRQFGLGWATNDAHDGLLAGPRKTIGGPLKTWRYTDEVGREVVAWVSSTSGAIELKRHEADDSWTFLHLLYANVPLGTTSTVLDAWLIPPADSRPARLVASGLVAQGGGDPEMVVCVYRDLGVLLDDAQERIANPEPAPGGGFQSVLVVYLGAAGADAVYSGTGPTYEWDEALPTVKLNCHASDTWGGDLWVVVPASETAAGATGLPLIGVTHFGGFTLLQDATLPADAPVLSRETESGPGIGVATLLRQPVAITLTADADIASDPRTGWAVVQELDDAGDDEARVEVLSLPLGRIIHSLAPGDVGLPEDAAGSGGGVAVIMNPPDVARGVRLVWGYLAVRGLVEWDLWSVSAASWSGPHYGGTKLQVNGWGLDLLTRMYVEGEPCLRWRRAQQDDGTVTVSGVTPSVGWLINEPPGPIVSDALVEAGTEWTRQVELRTNDGDVLILPDGFIYVSDLETEQTLRRTLARLPDAWLNTDPKANTLQRHIFLAAARLFTRFRSDALIPITASACISTATSRGLDLWGTHLRAPRPYTGMPDADYRAFLVAVLAFTHAGPTPTRILDIIEPILGVRPTMQEGYRSYTLFAELPAVGLTMDNHDFVGDELPADDEEKLGRGFLDRDFVFGDDGRITGANRALMKYRPAGVIAALRIRVEPA